MRKIIAIILSLCIVLALTGCGTTYEDTNGPEDFSLQTITDQNIIHLDVGASGLNFTEESLGDVVFSSEYSAKNFNGVAQIYTTGFFLPSDVEVYIGHMNVKQGNFKLAIVNDEQIIYEIPLDAFGDTFRFENISGSFSIHVAGESAAFEFYIDVQ